ncbi:MAG TPA: hypothetical protein VIN59_05405 [Alphaproteobacteria bacterium]
MIEFSESFTNMSTVIANLSLILGIPLSIYAFAREQRKERQNEQEEIYDKLMEHYAGIQDMLFSHPEIDQHLVALDDAEALRRQRIVYEMLVSLFERAYILLADEKDPRYQRMWNSWLDYINYWLNRPNFKAALPDMMLGEDPHFVRFISDLSGMDLKP